MAITFLDAYTELLDWVGRDATDPTNIARAKGCINDAILWMNRSYKFKVAESMSVVTYPANAAFVDLGVVCNGGTVSGLTSVQIINDVNSRTGMNIPLMSYGALQSARSQADNLNPVPQFYVSNPSSPLVNRNSFDAQVETNWKYISFLQGTNFGLHPKPTQPVVLLITYNSLFPSLVNDSDTSPFLTYCKDFVISKALQRMNIYIKDEAQRVAISDSQIDSDWRSVIRWDDELLTNFAVTSPN